MCSCAALIADVISAGAFHVTRMRSEISKPLVLRAYWLKLITSRTFPAAINSGVRARSRATLSAS